MAALIMMASVGAQANQCSSGGDCHGDGELHSAMSLLQTNSQINVNDATLPPMTGQNTHTAQGTGMNMYPASSSPSMAQLAATEGGQLMAAGRKTCQHHLSNVNDSAVSAVMKARKAVACPQKASPVLQNLSEQRVFIVTILHDSHKILKHWTFELIRLIMSLRSSSTMGCSSNVFVSIYESGSTDATTQLLEDLRGHLEFLGVSHSIVSGGLRRNGSNRIDYLGRLRNKALEPIHKTNITFDQVLWLNDVLYCADAALQVIHNAMPINLGGLGANAVCGLDLWVPPWDTECNVYDQWVFHDMGGNNIHGRRDIFRGKNLPFQVFSCWNGLVSFKADLFQDLHLEFRRGAPNQCAASEAELIFHDMWRAGRGRVAVVPSAAVAYNNPHFNRCVADSQPTSFIQSSITFQPAPRQVTCCSLPEDEDQVNWSECECQPFEGTQSPPPISLRKRNQKGCKEPYTKEEPYPGRPAALVVWDW